MLADGEEKRCPSCRTRLGNRGRPIVLGESNRISARPVLPIEFELQAQVVAENRAQERRRRVAVAAGASVAGSAPPSVGGAAPDRAAVPERPRHRPRRRRKLAPRTRIDTAPTPSPSRADADEIEAELVDLELEAAVAVPEVVVEPEVVETPEPVVREVVIPEVLFDDEVAATSDQQSESIPDLIDLTIDDEHEPAPDARPRVAPSKQHLFSASASSPRVKKIRAKGRKGWVVDYVVPEPDSDDTAS
jgi:hypothetical protein